MEIKDLQQTNINEDDLKKELLTIPNIILTLRKTLLSQENILSELISEKQEIELITMKQVVNEVEKSENGQEKIKYRNATQREIEVKQRTKQQKEYVELKKKQEKQTELVQRTKYDIEFCFNRQKALQHISPLYYGDKNK